MRCAVAVMLVALVGLAGLIGLGGCNDVRDFAGSWRGERVSGSSLPAADVQGRNAVLTIDAIDKHGLRGSLVVHSNDTAGPTVIDTSFSSLEAAEADVLATMTFAGDPVRVYRALSDLLHLHAPPQRMS